MKSKIKNLISTVGNERHHCEVFSMKNMVTLDIGDDQCTTLVEKIRVSVNESWSPRGLCYEIIIKPTSPTSSGKSYSYFGGKSHIKRILKQWLDGEKQLTPCGWSPYAQPAYMLAPLK